MKQKETSKRLGLAIKLLLAVAMGIILVRAIEWFKKERAFAVQNACLQNLRIIEGSKDQAAIELGIKEGGVITPEQVSRYIKNGFSSLKCGWGGVYTINPQGNGAICSVHHSALSPWP